MTEDDIVFPNNSNVIVVDEETAAASERERRFIVKCWYRVPASAAGHAQWDLEVVPFAALTLDVPGQRAFLIDVEGDERRRTEALANEKAQRAAEHD